MALGAWGKDLQRTINDDPSSPSQACCFANFNWVNLALAAIAVVAGCCCSDLLERPEVLRLATTTSTRDSGLLDQLLPPFEKQHQVRVDVIAAGTGKALKLGEAGDVDVVLVHARAAEEAFLAAGHAVRREDVMFNTFELVGPPDDPAQARELEVDAALQRIAATGSRFIARGDDSGTHRREMKLWESVGGRPTWSGYQESGQGMGATLAIAQELSAYTLTDRGTWLYFRDQIDLVPLAKQTSALHNPYGVLVVDPAKHPSIQGELADAFVDYLISPAAQQTIGDYQLRGEALFTPLHATEQTKP